MGVKLEWNIDCNVMSFFMLYGDFVWLLFTFIVWKRKV